MRSTPTSEHARFLELDSTIYTAQSWLPNWSAGGLTLTLAVKNMNKAILLMLMSCILLCSCSSKVLNNELVMQNGMTIKAKTKHGEIIIKAGSGFTRSYTWEGATRTAELWARKGRWYGSYGAYFPGPGFHWKEHTGIKRGVLDEGQQHFNTKEEALAWLKLPYNSDCVYRNDGLTVCYSKNLSRFQVNVSVWQIYIEGSKLPIHQETAGDRIWFYDPAYKPEIFKNSQKTTYYEGGVTPTQLPGSCDSCISDYVDN